MRWRRERERGGLCYAELAFAFIDVGEKISGVFRREFCGRVPIVGTLFRREFYGRIPIIKTLSYRAGV